MKNFRLTYVKPCFTFLEMPDPTIIAFRPSDTDCGIIARLTERLGLNVSSVIRLALRRLDEMESERRTDRTSSAKNTRKR